MKDNNIPKCDDCLFRKQCTLLYFPPCEGLARRDTENAIANTILDEFAQWCSSRYVDQQLRDFKIYKSLNTGACEE